MLGKTLMGSSALGALVLATMIAPSAWAQTAPAEASSAADHNAAAPTSVASDDTVQSLSEVVVTGTLMRGIAPVGTHVVGISREDVVASGAASSNDLLAAIPQVGSFGTAPRGNQDAGSPLVVPNLRNLGAGGATTLLLLDGHRMVGAGVLSTSTDPSIIPPAMIERVDVIPDGGSSIYGSDAIGGVINFITRRHFDGVEVSGRYGAADSYTAADANLTVGRDWDSGSFILSYAYAWHTNLLGADRDYATSNHLAAGGTDFRNTACAPGNITIGATTYALPGRVAGTLNRCDDQKAVDIYPRERRNSLFGSFTQQLTPNLEFVGTSYWSRRDTQILTAQSSLSGSVTATNPYFQPIGTEVAQTVAISFADVFGPSNVSNHVFDSYGFTPGLNLSLDHGWEVRASGNFGRSNNLIHEDLINAAAATVALGGTTTATALNPYDVKATNPAVLATIENFDNFGKASQRLAEGGVVADGPLMDMPGGQLRLAVGVEYHYENLKQRMTSGPRDVAGAPTAVSSRDVSSIFGEVFVPLVGDGNSRPGLRSLVLSASVRRDDYSDVGSTTNPKLGFTYKPFDDLTILGNFGTSFHAPGLAESASTVASQVQILQVSPFRPVTSPITDLFRPTIIIAGGNPNLRPETADTWSLGFKWKPRAIEGLSIGATYYDVDMTDVIGLVSPTTLFTDPNFAPFYIINPTLAQAQAAAGARPIVGAPSIDSLYVGRSPFLLVDARINNFGAIVTNGVDFDISYTRLVGRALVNASLAGTRTLKRDLASGQNGPYTDTLKNGTSDLFFVAALGAKIDAFTARASLNYRGGYPILGVVNQTKVDAFKTVDLFLSYEGPKGGAFDGTRISLNVDNVLDEDPPYFNSNIGYANGSTLGRLVALGVTKTF